jgi:hypothetical protein
MRNWRLFFICVFLIGAHGSYSQTSTTADSVAVDKACKDYAEGFYYGDTNRIRQAMHPELCKRILAKQRNYKIYNSTVDDLINAAKGRKPTDPDPSHPFAIKVDIYDMAYGIATAKITTNKMSFIDYAQLAKVNDDWKIVNVLWAFTR